MDSSDNTQPLQVKIRMTSQELSDEKWPDWDLLNREEEIKNLTPVLLNVEAPLVFALDAEWGAGKTTFIRLWRHHLEKVESKTCLYLNAWESDFAEDPLLPMLSTLDKWLSTNNKSPASRRAWDKAKKYAPGLLKNITISAAKAATFGVLDLEKEYERLATDLTGIAAGGILESFNVKLSSLQSFKESLQESLQALPDGQQNLIVFVDELDRCRPTYAVELLERIKHLFDIPRIVFVLSINRDQLSKSLKGVYGAEFDGLSYLKRFIDLDYHLQPPNLDVFIAEVLRQPDIVENMMARNGGDDQLNNLLNLTVWVAKRFNYSLRDISQTISRLRLILRATPQNQFVASPIVLILMALRQENLELYKKFTKNDAGFKEVLAFLLGEPLDVANLPQSIGWVCGWLALCTVPYKESRMPSQTNSDWLEVASQITNESERDWAKKHFQEIIDSLHQNLGIKDRIYSRIELMSKIELS